MRSLKCEHSSGFWFLRKLLLPLQDARASCCRFRFRNVARFLQCNREAGMGQRIVGRQPGQRQCGGNRSFESFCITQRANQPVMAFDMHWVSFDRMEKRFRRADRIALSQ